MKDWKRIVIKVGSNVLTDDNGVLDREVMSDLVNQISSLKQEGIEVVLVSSGAVGAGKSMISLPENTNKVTKRQILASIGQIELMSFYQRLFDGHQIQCAQVLATKEDFRDRIHFVNMKTCLLALLRDQVIPVINENDVISISELMFTDNDELAGLTASLIDADSMVILSTVDGVMKNNQPGQIIKNILPGDKTIYSHISSSTSIFGRGGMLTKVKICQKAARLGIQCIIANGKKPEVLRQLRSGKQECSYFVPMKKRSSLKKWMAYSGNKSIGYVVVNEGAEEILCNPAKVASLLAVGVIAVVGKFEKGELIEIRTRDSRRIGLGLAGHSSDEARKIIGKPSKKPVIHYNYLHIGE